MFFDSKNLEEASKNYNLAIDNLENAIDIDLKNDITLLNLGTAYLNLGNVFNSDKLEEASKNYNLAIDNLSEAIKIDQKMKKLF